LFYQINQGSKQMAQRKHGVFQSLYIKECAILTYDIRFRGKTLEYLFGINQYRSINELSFNFKHRKNFKCTPMFRHSLYDMANDIIIKHCSSSYFSKEILKLKNVYVLISMLVSVANNGFSKRIRHDYAKHWNANHLSYGNSRFMHEFDERFKRIDMLMNSEWNENDSEHQNQWLIELALYKARVA
jgi:hypothetical protein